MKYVFLQTFGCQMNEYDSELVRSILEDAGYSFAEAEEDADIIMLNTCSVRENAHRKVFGYIHEIRHRRQGKPVLIGILGCMATGLRDELLADKKLALDFVVGPDSYKRLPEILKNVQDDHARGYDVTLSEFETYSDVDPTRVSGVNAWVAVMRGCNNFCAFCIVPYTRGRERSRSVANVLGEVKRLADEGFQQVTLLGQNVNSYHHESEDFAALLDAVSKIEGIRRIRFTSPHPKDFPQSLIKVVAENPKVCKQIHLPLQAGNDRVLELMNRSYTGKEFRDLVTNIRKACPKIALTTDVIVGFPTETDAEFEDTYRVMREVEFDSAFMFKYSPRPKTMAARKLKDDVSELKKTARIVKLNILQTAISLKKNKALVGDIQEILMEQAGKIKAGSAYGRNDANKIVTLPQGEFKPGQWVQARIVRATPHQLKGELNSPTN
ncbi:MAG: tRNA (N6-isopentenyl adenosine(37)-C2)-methylthiotransferase MiaB [Candidatus Omnitrophica bacterium]|nr:tRNA (N6-isopentenyl adenosine(37)-C2)-methylthiotransferase MiaB [Candidatus Omnitrophota bacterium]